MTQATLICPKCGGSMLVYERSGITVDQCGQCRGIYLDRGELERLIDAEAGYYGGGSAAAAPPQGYYQPKDHHAQGGHGQGGHGQGSGRRRRGGFLGNLFD